MGERLRFRKSQRIRQRADFARILRARRSAADDLLVVYVAASTGGGPRIGVRASRRLGSAVARNRARRRVKEAFRLQQHDLPALDLVCVLRRTDATLAQFAHSLRTLAAAAQRKLNRPARSRSGARHSSHSSG